MALRRRMGSAASSRDGLQESARYRAAVLTTAVLSNNAPDFDFAYVGITSGKLGYLLHHRGHTHTLVAVLLLGLLVLALVWFGFRFLKPALTRVDVVPLGVLGVLGGLLHVLMDYCNNYGVHPFWPLHDGWFYGDAIFIVDPWLLVVLIGMALGIGNSRAFRGVLLLALLGVLGLAWGVRLASAWLATLLTVFAAVWVGALWRASYRRRTLIGGAALALSWLVLLATRHVARASVRAALELSGDEGLELADLVSTPAPGNPLCWSILAVQFSERQYVVRRATASGWPALFNAARCHPMNEGQTAPLVPSSVSRSALEPERLIWGPEFRAPRAELTRLREESCVARAFLRFARVPFWIEHAERATLIGDLRFDRSSAVEFAELPLVSDAPCPRHEPPWLPPLAID